MHVKIENTAFGRECNVPWESMQELGPGCRFCAHCSQEIRDFSKLSRQEVKTLLKENQDLCGVFDIHQFAYEVKLPSPKWLMGVLIPVWLMAEPEEVRGKQVNLEQLVVNKSEFLKLEELNKKSIEEFTAEKDQSIDQKNRRRLYLSRRFPFIHFRRQRCIGRIMNPSRL